jgi:two-component system chemotaxis sensor kinase CheA
MEVKAEYLAIFSEEAADQLREWEESLLALEKSPSDSEPLNNLFRAIHTLKGSAGFIGFDLLQKLAHDLESSLSSVRDGQRPYDGTLSDLLFQGLDLARSLIEKFAGGGAEATAGAAADVEGLLARLAAAAAPAKAAEVVNTAPEGAATGAADAAAGASAATGGTSRLLVRIEGQNREAYLRSCIVKARLDRLGTVLAMDPSPDSLRDATDPFVYTVTISSALGAADLASSISVDQVSVAPAPAAPPAAADAPAAHAAASADAVEAAPETAATAETADRDGAKPSRGEPRGARPEEVVRVSVQKLDTLLNLVGELVIHNSGFVATTQQLKEQYGKTPAIYDLEEKTEALSGITRDLQDGIMKARMLPIASVFNRFRRVVRDLAKASGKSVVLEVFGEETEIDKKVIDRIGEPLVHLVRNAVDHGLETTTDRRSAGKAESGTIRLGAFQDGDHICIEISDDGRGLNREAILRKALEKGLISGDEAARAGAEQILSFIFMPGFSTARVVTDISGRGVGMDAVKRAVEEMNGSLRVRSTPGAGTTVTISLPLTTAIITAVLVEASGATYAIPISAVREIVKATEAMLRTVGTRKTMLLRNEVLAMVSLGGALRNGAGQRGKTRAATTDAGAGDGGAVPAAGPVVVVDYEGNKIGLEVDRILGSREVVIKSLSRHYREVDGLIGASILGNGKIALIVDVETMISRHHSGPRGTAVKGAAVTETAVRGAAAVQGTMTPMVVMPTAVTPGMPEPVLPMAVMPVAVTPPPVVPAAVTPESKPKAPATAAPIEQLARDVSGARGRLLEDVNNQGAIQASMSLSQLTGQEIRVSFPESRLVAIKDVAEAMGGEERVVGGMYVGIQGDLAAGMLLVIPEANLLVLDDLLHQRPAGTTRNVSDVDLSAISEMGNLLAACFLNAMADAAHLALSPEVPEISIDMCLPVIDSVLARFNQPGDTLLLTEAVIYVGGSENVVCHQVLFLEPDSYRRLMTALAAAERGAPAVGAAMAG